MKTFIELVNELEANIELLKKTGFTCEKVSDFLYVVDNGVYSGIGETELAAWQDILLDVGLANEIFREIDRK